MGVLPSAHGYPISQTLHRRESPIGIRSGHVAGVPPWALFDMHITWGGITHGFAVINNISGFVCSTHGPPDEYAPPPIQKNPKEFPRGRKHPMGSPLKTLNLLKLLKIPIETNSP